ncbi:AMP-binding protein [Ramlibacter albus]|uniref:AMP-binding protein n=1 Tax=Ramlibacter albus TaxID=2079448 RepID=A0A923M988_9BURK|nr:AMP-binding protein [Ramlibacter albus]MBC5765715.1 AMP-binding protein [Ramlibacter albus]
MNSPTHEFHAARDLLFELREQPVAAVERFRWPRLRQFNWALDHFDAISQGNDATALWIVEADGREYRASFAQLSARSSQVANFLRAQGVARGDRILLMLGNEPALWECALAAMKLGAVVIPATSLLTPDDLRDRLDRGNVRHVIAGAANASKFEGLAGEYRRIVVGGAHAGWVDYAASNTAPTDFRPDAPTAATDPLLLYFTSGTTSKPKLVLHTHESYPVGHLSTMFWLGLRPDDVHLNISSPGWAKHAWSCFFAPWNAGCCVFIHNTPRFNAQALLQTLERCRVTSLCAPPTVWRMLIQEDLGAWRNRLALRSVAGAGEPLNPEIIEQVRAAWGLTLRDGYGQTETTAQVGNSPGLPLKPGSMGLPLPGYRIVLLDVDGHEAQEGEVCIDLKERPVGLMVGYLDSEEKTADATRGGFYHTGNTAARDADGYLTFVGRADDVFKASDYRISPFELESVLMEHDDVAEVAIVPSPDPVRLAVPKAYVTLKAGRTAGAEVALSILAFARQRLAPYKRVRRIEFVVELPKTISGKIRRVQLRAQEVSRGGATPAGGLAFAEEDFPGLRGDG